MDTLVEYTRAVLQSLIRLMIWIYKLHRILLVELRVPSYLEYTNKLSEQYMYISEHGTFYMAAQMGLLGGGLFVPALRVGLAYKMFVLSFGLLPWYWVAILSWVVFMIPSFLFFTFQAIFQIVMLMYFFAYPEKRKNEEKPKHRLEITGDGEADQDIQQWIADDNGNNSAFANHS